MTDPNSIIRQFVEKENDDMPFPVMSENVGRFMPRSVHNDSKTPHLVPANQGVTALESMKYLKYYNAKDTLKTDGSTWKQYSVGTNNNQAAATWEIGPVSGEIWEELTLQFEITTPTTNTAGTTLMPGPYFVDRFESAVGHGNQFQSLPGSIVFKMMIASLPPEKLYQYALQSGQWLNHANHQSNILNVAVAAANEWQSKQTVNGGQTITGLQIVPAGTFTTGTDYLTQAGKFITIRFPLYGIWLQQIGALPIGWFRTDKPLTFKLYAECPAFKNNGTEANSVPTAVNETARFFLIARCALAPPAASKKLVALETALDGKGPGLHMAYLKYTRQDVPIGSAFSSGVTKELSLSGFNGHHVSFLIATAVVAKTVTATTGGSGWKFGIDATAATKYMTASLFGGAGNGGQRTHLGDRASTGYPAVDLLTNNKDKIFTADKVPSTSFDEHLNLNIGPRLVNNPWTLGLVPGADSIAPLYYADIPIFIGNPLNAIQGMYDGSIKFKDFYLRVIPGANCDTAITMYEVVVAHWAALHLKNVDVTEVQLASLSKK